MLNIYFHLASGFWGSKLINPWFEKKQVIELLKKEEKGFDIRTNISEHISSIYFFPAKLYDRHEMLIGFTPAPTLGECPEWFKPILASSPLFK